MLELVMVSRFPLPNSGARGRRLRLGQGFPAAGGPLPLMRRLFAV